MNYYIDHIIISMFLGIDKHDTKVFDYLTKYSERLSNETEKTIRDYLLKDKNMSEEDITKMFEKIDIKNPESMVEFIEDDNIQLISAQVKEGLNKQIYDYYSQTLSEEKKKEINEYLDTLEKDLRKDAKEERAMIVEILEGIEKEYNETGTIELRKEEGDTEEVEKEEIQEINVDAVQQAIDKELGSMEDKFKD